MHHNLGDNETAGAAAAAAAMGSKVRQSAVQDDAAPRAFLALLAILPGAAGSKVRESRC
jgi:hypothetical protein